MPSDSSATVAFPPIVGCVRDGRADGFAPTAAAVPGAINSPFLAESINVDQCQGTWVASANDPENSRRHWAHGAFSVPGAPAGSHRSIDSASNVVHKFHTDLSPGGHTWSRLTLLRTV